MGSKIKAKLIEWSIPVAFFGLLGWGISSWNNEVARQAKESICHHDTNEGIIEECRRFYMHEEYLPPILDESNPYKDNK